MRTVFVCDNQGLMVELVTNFLTDKPKRKVFGNFRIEDDGIYYRTKQKVKATNPNFDLISEQLKAGLITMDDENKVKLGARSAYCIEYFEESVNVVAKRIKRDGELDLILGNSSILDLIGAYSAYGNFKANRSETLVQRILSRHVRMVPFSAFQEAGLDLNKIKLLDQSGPETLKRKVPNPNYRSWAKASGPKFIIQDVHFTGASLFEIEGKYFLLDIDRNEIKHRIFNPFVVQLSKKAQTIADAYQQLKPKLVVDAERKGKKVLRQGEWFFVPAKAPKIPKINESTAIKILAASVRWGSPILDATWGVKRSKDLTKKLQKEIEGVPKPTSLQAGPNRPNNAQLGVTIKGVTYVSGTVKHSGREHADLKLKGWYIAIPNTATKSVTITGDID